MRIAAFALCLVQFAGCSSRRVQHQAGDSLTQRARDSVIGASKLPGASGVRGAMRAADSAQARRLLEDSVTRIP